MTRADDFRRAMVDHHGAVSAYVRRRLPDAEVEDAVAEVLARAWAGWPPDGDPLPWLYGIARNVVLEGYRGRERDARSLGAAAALERRRRSDGPEDITGVMAVGQAMAQLRPADREILRLAAWEGLDDNGLAAALGIRGGTARVRLHRARARLAAELDRMERQEG